MEVGKELVCLRLIVCDASEGTDSRACPILKHSMGVRIQLLLKTTGQLTQPIPLGPSLFHASTLFVGHQW